jgi:hypothetical protein
MELRSQIGLQFGRLHYDLEININTESIRKNIKIAAQGSLCWYERKKRNCCWCTIQVK